MPEILNKTQLSLDLTLSLMVALVVHLRPTFYGKRWRKLGSASRITGRQGTGMQARKTTSPVIISSGLRRLEKP
jgi:hypothetical protein